ncbi:MAG TPA: hypothetical protein VMV61_06440 [Patescibacteria group bacterium]|nr:hypothetical protein [Patescibacteria group bacterium]
MPSSTPSFGQRIAPWLLAFTLALALLQAYRMNPVEEFRIGTGRREAIPPCRTNPIQIFDAPAPAVSPDLCWAHAGDRVIWTFPNNPDRVFHVHMSPHPFTGSPGDAFEADSTKGVIGFDPVRVASDYTVYKYMITYDEGKKKIDPHVVIMK